MQPLSEIQAVDPMDMVPSDVQALDPLDHISPKVVAKVLPYLDKNEQLNLRLVSRNWKKFVDNYHPDKVMGRLLSKVFKYQEVMVRYQYPDAIGFLYDEMNEITQRNKMCPNILLQRNYALDVDIDKYLDRYLDALNTGPFEEYIECQIIIRKDEIIRSLFDNIQNEITQVEIVEMKKASEQFAEMTTPIYKDITFIGLNEIYLINGNKDSNIKKIQINPLTHVLSIPYLNNLFNNIRIDAINQEYSLGFQTLTKILKGEMVTLEIMNQEGNIVPYTFQKQEMKSIATIEEHFRKIAI